jgi:hypothetical protein
MARLSCITLRASTPSSGWMRCRDRPRADGCLDGGRGPSDLHPSSRVLWCSFAPKEMREAGANACASSGHRRQTGHGVSRKSVASQSEAPLEPMARAANRPRQPNYVSRVRAPIDFEPIAQSMSRADDTHIRSEPAVVIDGRLADCCSGRGMDKETLRAEGIGQPIP